MSDMLEKNKAISEKFKRIIGLRHEPVAIKLVKKGEVFPGGFDAPEKPAAERPAPAPKPKPKMTKLSDFF